MTLRVAVLGKLNAGSGERTGCLIEACKRHRAARLGEGATEIQIDCGGGERSTLKQVSSGAAGGETQMKPHPLPYAHRPIA